MNEMDLWRLTPHYTIVEAAALIIGADPECVYLIDDYEDTRDFYVNGEHSNKFHPVYTAIKRSLINKSLNCANTDTLMEALEHMRPPQQQLAQGEPQPERIKLVMKLESLTPSVCQSQAILSASEIKTWLKKEGFTTGFFFPNANVNNVPDYLNKDHPCFTPKLYAAIRVWEGVALDGDNYGKPKQRMTKWLEARAADLGLIHEVSGPSYEKGDLKSTAIEQICSVANWNQDGGRGTKEPQNTNLPPKSAKLPTAASSSDDDDPNIPF